MAASEASLSLPRLALTVGEPAGIGPDIIIGAAQSALEAQLVVIADPDLLESRARRLGVPLELTEYRPDGTGEPQRPGRLCCLPQPLRRGVAPGRPDPRNAGRVLDAIETAVRGCLTGAFAAMATAPVSKAVIAEGGFAFTGHTEYIAALCDGALPVMMLMNDFARVALLTTHLPLAQVPGQVTRRRLRDVITVVHDDLKAKFGIAKPRLRVCGLNPHAGEQGLLGREEIDAMIPTLEALREQGLTLLGPAPADTAFTPASLCEVDAVVAMFHDQGLPALKSQGFGKTVNITLGLPIIRTSVDHGTAFDLAGTGRAETSSMDAALRCALALGARRRASRLGEKS